MLDLVLTGFSILILFLDNIAEGKRGGEVYFKRLFNFIKNRFEGVKPKNMEQLPPYLHNPIKHMFFRKKMVDKYQPNLVIVDISSAFRSFLAIYSMKKMKKAIAVIVQEERQAFRYNLFFMKWIVRRFERYLLRSASLVVVNSKYIANRSRRFIRKGIPVIIAYPGLELNANSCAQNRSDFGLVKPPFELLFVGQCACRKGLRFLVEAVEILNDLDIYLHIAGDYNESSEYFAEIKQIIIRGKLQDRITFHGFCNRQQLDKYYLNSDIFVIPSLSEGFGMALAEALCFGLPVVASKVGAIPEMVEDEVNAILVEAGNPIKLAGAIRRLCQDSRLRNKMSQANLEKAKKLPTWDDFYRTLDDKLIPLIKKVLGDKK